MVILPPFLMVVKPVEVPDRPDIAPAPTIVLHDISILVLDARVSPGAIDTDKQREGWMGHT